MGDSETFGIEKDHGEEVTQWLNEQAKSQGLKLEARLYGYSISTTKTLEILKCFHGWAMFKLHRKLIIKASKRFKIKVIEGGYKPKEKVFRMKKFDYAKVKKRDKTIGQIRICSIKIWK